MVLTLDRNHLSLIYTHAERTYPEECCGLLLGKLTMGNKRLVDVRPTANTWEANLETDTISDASLTKARRYWIDPQEMLGVMKDARSRDLDIIGIYHSHPNNPAVPSECDRQLAWTQYSYLIVSVQQGRAVEQQSWQLDDQQQFQPEAIVVVESAIP